MYAPDSTTPPDSISRSSSPGQGGPQRRVVSGSLRDRIAKFNNPSAPPPVPKQHVPSAPVSRGMVGNRIPSLDRKSAGILGVTPDKRVPESRGMIGNRIPSVTGGGYSPVPYQNTGSNSGGTPTKTAPAAAAAAAARDTSPAGSASGSVDSSAASATVDNSVSPTTSRSSTPPSSPGTAGMAATDNIPPSLVAATLPSLNANLGTSTPSSTRAEAGDTVSEFSLSVPSTPMGNSTPLLPAPEYDLVAPNLKLATGSTPHPMTPGVSSQSAKFAPSVSSSLATQSVGSEEEIQMMADVSGVSTPMGTPRAARRGLGEGSVAGDGSIAGDDEGSVKDLSGKTDKLDLDEDTAPSDETLSTPVNEVRAPTIPEPFETTAPNKEHEVSSTPKSTASSSDPNKEHDLAALKQGQLDSSSPPGNVPSGAIDDMAANAMTQKLGEHTIAPEEKKVQGGQAGQFMEDVEIPDEILVPPANTRQEYGGQEELQVQEIGTEGDKEVIKTDEERAAEEPDVVTVGEDVPSIQSAKEPEPKKTDSETAAEESDVVAAAEDVPATSTSENANNEVIKIDAERAAESPEVVTVGKDVPATQSASHSGEEKLVKTDEEKTAEVPNVVVGGKDVPEVQSAEQDGGAIKTDQEKAAEAPDVITVGEDVPAVQPAGGEESAELIKTDEERAAEEPDVVVAGQDVPVTHAAEDKTPISETKIDQPQIAAVGSEMLPEDVISSDRDKDVKQLEVEPAPTAPSIQPTAPTFLDVPSSVEVVDNEKTSTGEAAAPDFPTPPVADPDVVDPISETTSLAELESTQQSTLSNPNEPADTLETPIDKSMLKYFPEVPDEEKPRVEVHVSSPAVTPAKSRKESTGDQKSPIGLPSSSSEKSLGRESDVANLQGQSKSISRSTLDNVTPSKSSLYAIEGDSSDQLDTMTPEAAKRLSKSNSTRKSPKSPLLDDEDPGDFEPGEGWAVVTK
ncbi:hypothetical protein D1P53_004332 [Cryptococcus gattii VGV]|nr:hypothetical protein D1P53_004332 [Cryptococcus gattii VGV]